MENQGIQNPDNKEELLERKRNEVLSQYKKEQDYWDAAERFAKLIPEPTIKVSAVEDLIKGLRETDYIKIKRQESADYAYGVEDAHSDLITKLKALIGK